MKKWVHGADYNPEQWLRYPGIIDEDFRLLKLAHLNSISVGIFSWAALEVDEGRFEFGWLDDIFARAKKDGVQVVLATPSGGKPNWLALRYPEVRRVNRSGQREPQAFRHNHCLTSPIYREKVRTINARLAERYGRHPSLALWHISNEYGGYCYCDLCKSAFQEWLRNKYHSLENLNETYWSRFWSHTYTDWNQIQDIDGSVIGLVLDWKRFMTEQCRSFIRNEAGPLRADSPQIPITTNLMTLADDYNYWELAQEIDVVSWDSYPAWHTGVPEGDECGPALLNAFHHDAFRSMKGGRPFLLMETTPSQVNWMKVSPLRRPGMHRLNGLQAVAHGSDGVCYFQFRKSRGSSEQHHGAVVDHAGHEHTRVFRDVADLGICLEKISDVAGGRVPAKVAVVFDWENWWTIDATASPQNEHKNYVDTVLEHYRPFWEQGIPVDVIDSTAALDSYDLVVAPMLQMLREGVGEKLTAFVERGGTLVSTYQTGLVESTGRCILGGAPGPLRKVLGIWVEEFDALPETARREVVSAATPGHGLSGSYQARHFLDLIHTEGAEVLATYGDDFYAGRPAVTVNRLGRGSAYYIASRNDNRFHNDFFGFLLRNLALARTIKKGLPQGVSAHPRVIDGRTYVFILNFRAKPARLDLEEQAFADVETGQLIGTALELESFGSRVLLASSRNN